MNISSYLSRQISLPPCLFGKWKGALVVIAQGKTSPFWRYKDMMGHSLFVCLFPYSMGLVVMKE